MNNLRILDGKDRNGQPLDIHVLSDIPGLEQFMEYLSSSTDHYSDITQLDRVKSKPKCMEIQSKEPYNAHLKEQSKDDDGCSSELKLRLQDLENKLAKFVGESARENMDMVKDSRSEPEIISNMTEINLKDLKRTENRDKKENSDIKIANLMKELNKEQHTRMDLENKLQVVINKYKDVQLMLVNDKKSKSDAIKSTEQLASAYSKEKAVRHELEDNVSDLEVRDSVLSEAVIFSFKWSDSVEGSGN